MGVFKKLLDKLENQCFELDRRIQLAETEELPENDVDEKIWALQAAQKTRSQARELHQKANTLQELLNLQHLHSDVTIMPAYITEMQKEKQKLLENAKQEARI